MYRPLIDKHNRKISSVRISLTDRCNFRCKYCMPDGTIDWTPKKNILTFEELTRLVDLFYKSSIRKFRLTGGEPTIRHNFEIFCETISKKYPDIELSMTTNGHKLKEIAERLKEVGISRLNVSLDIFDRDKFNNITQREYYDDILVGIDMAASIGIKVKINAVSMKTFNDDKVSLNKFIEYSANTGIEIRFIELMPFTGNDWSADKYLSSEDLRTAFNRIEPLEEIDKDSPSQTSRVFIGKSGAKIGFISSVSESFCESCDRIRITADGNLRPCLHANKEYSLRDLMRSGASDEELLNVIRDGLNEKWASHPDFLELQYLPPMSDREMIRIGG